jgi:very-short-patch-repair endonuclease
VKYIAPEEARTKRGNLRYLNELRELSRGNRNRGTVSEKAAWNEIFRKEKLGYKFTRQKPIGKFVIDFYCSKLLLAIEIDGGSHKTKEYLDRERDRYLEQRGIKTIRVKDHEVIARNKEVMEIMRREINEREKEVETPH